MQVMNFKFGLKALSALVVIGFSTIAFAQTPLTFFGAAPANRLEAAHAAYLKGDTRTMSHEIVESMKEHHGSALVLQNAKALLNSAYNTHDGKLPTAFKIPNSLEWLALVSRRVEFENKVSFRTEVKGTLIKDLRVVDLKLIAYPHRVLLDLRDTSQEFKQNGRKFYLHTGRTEEALPDGLYKIALTLSDGSSFEDWVPVVDFAAKAGPQVTSPQDGEISRNLNPQITWTAPTEIPVGAYKRKQATEVIFSSPPEYGWDIVWALYEPSELRTSCVVGREPGATGVQTLSRGRYLANVTYSADRKYGELTLSIQSANRTAFHVR